MHTLPEILKGKRGLVIGVANEHSIAAGCAQAFHTAGATLALTYMNDIARPYVEPVAESLGASLLMPLDMQKDNELEKVFSAIRDKWGSLDFVLHSVAFCPAQDLHGRVVDCSLAGFTQAMDVSVHSFIRTAHEAEKLMPDGGSLLTVSYYGAEKVVDHYNIMGPVKAALEASVCYLAAELGQKGIRVNALSPGPVKTRAASGIAHFDDLIEKARTTAPEHRLVSLEEIGSVAAGLVSDYTKGLTGNISYVDAGYHVMA